MFAIGTEKTRHHGPQAQNRPKAAPAILLLHGFSASSHMFRELIPGLANRYNVVASDLPSFGFSDASDRQS
jgi:pimeloyl-ACP methyl ester carboxylesterase